MLDDGALGKKLYEKSWIVSKKQTPITPSDWRSGAKSRANEQWTAIFNPMKRDGSMEPLEF